MKVKTYDQGEPDPVARQYEIMLRTKSKHGEIPPKFACVKQ